MKTLLRLAALVLVLMLSPRLALVDAALAAKAPVPASAADLRDADAGISSEACARADRSAGLDQFRGHAVSVPDPAASAASVSAHSQPTKKRWGATKRWKLVERHTVEMVRRTRSSGEADRPHLHRDVRQMRAANKS